MTESAEERVSVAALDVKQSRFESAIEIYKETLDKHPTFAALHFYAAVCYSRLEFYDAALESLDVYQERHPDCICASTLKACAIYKTTGPTEALEIFQQSLSQAAEKPTPLIQHNQAVFRGGENGRAVKRPIQDKSLESECCRFGNR